MSNKSEASSGGIGFCGLLAIVFITLKLMGYIAWSWVWVLAPMWVPVALVVSLLAIAGIFALVANIK
jgi:hypothetical protein